MAFPTIPTVAAGRVLFANQANTTATRTFPAFSGLTYADGDLLLAIIVTYQSTTNPQFSSWSNGFTEVSDQGTSTTLGIGVAYKYASGTESGSLTVTQAATITGHASMCLLAIPGARLNIAPEVGTKANGTTAAADAGAFNPAGWDTEDTLWIAVAGSGMTSGTGSWTATGTTYPANYTNGVDSNTADNSTVGQTEIAVAFRQLNAASEDIGTFGVDTSNARNSALVIAVRPAAAIEEADADSDGIATTDVNGVSLFTGVANSDGVATAQADGEDGNASEIIEADAASDGVAATDVDGASVFAGVADSDGVAATDVDGAAHFAGVAASDGVAVTDIDGAAHFAAVFGANGIADVQADGEDADAGPTIVEADASSDGTAIADVDGVAVFIGAAASSGVAVPEAASTTLLAAIAAADGVAVTDADSSSIATSVVSAEGIAEVAGLSSITVDADGVSAGSAIGLFVGEDAAIDTVVVPIEGGTKRISRQAFIRELVDSYPLPTPTPIIVPVKPTKIVVELDDDDDEVVEIIKAFIALRRKTWGSATVSLK